MTAIERWKETVKKLKREAHALVLACKDPRTPWYAKLVAGGVVAYLFSPIDLIPDFIPVLGYLDDLVLVPIGIAIALRLIPPEVMADCRVAAQAASERPANRVAAAVIVGIWILLVVVGVQLLRNAMRR